MLISDYGLTRGDKFQAGSGQETDAAFGVARGVAQSALRGPVLQSYFVI
ncbi:hypothetical protein [Streptomyces sp. NPDC101776]